MSKQEKTVINPYRLGAGLILRRLLWDLMPISIRSRNRLKRWKNKYSGKKAVILCNGPSLNKVDFDYLHSTGLFTFGLNKINLLFERTQFRPSSIVTVNRLVIEQNKDFFNSTEIPLFVDYKNTDIINDRRTVHFLHSTDIKQVFAKDCSMSVCQGNTVTYVAMQLAYHMGFSKVALVGCDHYFRSKGPSNLTVDAPGTDSDHFDPRYFSGEMKWQLPDLVSSEAHYDMARQVFENDGREIVNCTDGGSLEIYRRMSLKEFADGK